MTILFWILDEIIYICDKYNVVQLFVGCINCCEYNEELGCLASSCFFFFDFVKSSLFPQGLVSGLGSVQISDDAACDTERVLLYKLCVFF